MPWTREPMLQRTLENLLLAGILGIGGLGLKVAQRTLDRVTSIELTLGKDQERSAADRESAKDVKTQVQTLVEDVSQLKSKIERRLR